METKLISFLCRLAILSFAALYSCQGLSQEKAAPIAYQDLFPARRVVEAASGNPFILRLVADHTADLNACLGTVNDQAAMKTSGQAIAQSGNILISFHNDPQAGRTIDVKSGAYRYSNLESCLMRTVKDASLDDDGKAAVIDGKILFHISCDLKRLSDSAWRSGAQVERKCSMRWEVGQ